MIEQDQRRGEALRSRQREQFTLAVDDRLAGVHGSKRLGTPLAALAPGVAIPNAAKLAGPVPHRIKVVSANMLFIAKEGLPEGLINRLVRLAAFQNPEFYQAQSLRLSTFGKPRIIGCAEHFPNHLALPRGCADEVRDLLQDCGTKLGVEDKRRPGNPIDASFHGALRAEQA